MNSPKQSPRLGPVYCLFLWLLALGVHARLMAAPEEAGQVFLTLAGANGFAAEKQVPVRDAVLYVDSTNFDGKSGFVRLQKGMTVAYLVLASREISAETEGTFEKKPFLQENAVPYPRLPSLSAPEDFVLMISFIDSYDPRKQASSTLQQAVAGRPITKLSSMAPWISSVEVPSVVIEQIHLHRVDATARTPSLPGKILGNHAPLFRQGANYTVITTAERSLRLETEEKKPPFRPAPVILLREAGQWFAALDLKSKELSVRGRVPIRLLPPVSRTINEYAGKE